MTLLPVAFTDNIVTIAAILGGGKHSYSLRAAPPYLLSDHHGSLDPRTRLQGGAPAALGSCGGLPMPLGTMLAALRRARRAGAESPR